MLEGLKRFMFFDDTVCFVAQHLCQLYTKLKKEMALAVEPLGYVSPKPHTVVNIQIVAAIGQQSRGYFGLGQRVQIPNSVYTAVCPGQNMLPMYHQPSGTTSGTAELCLTPTLCMGVRNSNTSHQHLLSAF